MNNNYRKVNCCGICNHSTMWEDEGALGGGTCKLREEDILGWYICDLYE